MALVVEDGSGLSNSEAYVSVADADTYHTNHGNSAWTGTDGVKEIALRNAAQFLEGRYRGMFDGAKRTKEQAMSWPRSFSFTVEGWQVPHDEIPQALKDANAELALRALSGELVADITDPTGSIKSRKRRVGPLEEDIEYQSGARHTVYPEVDLILSNYLSGSHSNVELVRA